MENNFENFLFLKKSRLTAIFNQIVNTIRIYNLKSKLHLEFFIELVKITYSW